MFKKTFVWPILIIAETTGMNGNPRKIHTTIEGAGYPELAMKNYIRSRKNSWEWLGVGITGITPLGQKIHIVYEG